MSKVFAIAALTLKEAYRKKVFLVLLIFALALVSSSAFFPVMDAETRIALVKIWSVRAITFFSALVAIFLASVSIPSDVEERRIYTLVSKPVSKPVIFLGKFFGFAGVIVIFLLVTGAITLAYIRLVQVTSSVNVTLDPKPQILAETVKRKNAERKGDEDSYRLQGKVQNSLVWVFTGINLSNLPSAPQLEVTLNVEDMRNDIMYTAFAEVKVINPETKEEKSLQVLDPNTGKYIYPYIRSNTPLILEFPKELISSKGELNVEISRRELDSIIWAKSASITIYEKSRNFELNYMRGLGLVCFQTLIVLAASLMASAFLGGPVAMFFGIAVFFSGSIYSFVETSLKTAETLVKHQKDNPSGYTRPEDIPIGVVEASAYITKQSLKVIPNFKTFEISSYLLENKWISNGVLRAVTVYGGLYIFSLLILGTLIMKARDFS